MSKWIKCLVVSLVIGLAAPLITTTAEVIMSGQGVTIPDDFSQVQNKSPEEVRAYMESGHSREVGGAELLLIPFIVPGALTFYAKAVVTTFLIALLATTSATFWIGRRR